MLSYFIFNILVYFRNESSSTPRSSVTATPRSSVSGPARGGAPAISYPPPPPTSDAHVTGYSSDQQANYSGYNDPRYASQMYNQRPHDEFHNLNTSQYSQTSSQMMSEHVATSQYNSHATLSQHVVTSQYNTHTTSSQQLNISKTGSVNSTSSISQESSRHRANLSKFENSYNNNTSPQQVQAPNPVPRKMSQPIMTTYQNIPANSKAAMGGDHLRTPMSQMRLETATPNRFHAAGIHGGGQDSGAESPGDFRRSASARLPNNGRSARFSQEDSDENKKNNSDQVTLFFVVANLLCCLPVLLAKNVDLIVN